MTLDAFASIITWNFYKWNNTFITKIAKIFLLFRMIDRDDFFKFFDSNILIDVQLSIFTFYSSMYTFPFGTFFIDNSFFSFASFSDSFPAVNNKKKKNTQILVKYLSKINKIQWKCFVKFHFQIKNVSFTLLFKFIQQMSHAMKQIKCVWER